MYYKLCIIKKLKSEKCVVVFSDLKKGSNIVLSLSQTNYRIPLLPHTI